MTFARRRPYVFSFLLLLLFSVVLSLEPTVDQLTDLPYNLTSICVEAVLGILLIVVVSAMHWWRKIGFRGLDRPKRLWIYLPALTLFATNLAINLIRGGIHVPEWTTFWLLALSMLTVGFVEEVMFRGLMLRALLPRGEWTAVLVTTVLFGLLHFGNVLAGPPLERTYFQVAYALAIGFGFAAMALRGGLLWPLIVAHALGNFMGAFDTQADPSPVNALYITETVIYVVVYVGYGIYLMRKKSLSPHSDKSTAVDRSVATA